MRQAALLALLALAPAVAAHDAVLVFHERAQVERVEVRLRDLAEIRTADRALAQRLEALPLGWVPRGGAQRTFRRAAVLAQIARLPRAPDVAARGARSTTVALVRKTRSAASLVAAARAHLARELHARYPALARLELEPAGDVPDLRLPPGEVVLTPRALGDLVIARRMCVWLDVELAGRTYRSVPVWLRVDARAPVLVARRSLKPREEIGADDVELEVRDIAGLREPGVSDPAELAGLRTRTYIPAGAIVQARQLEPSPSVTARQLVNVRVVSGGVVIDTQAIAEQDGYIGDLVELRNPKTSAVFSARVVGDNAVAITRR